MEQQKSGKNASKIKETLKETTKQTQDIAPALLIQTQPLFFIQWGLKLILN